MDEQLHVLCLSLEPALTHEVMESLGRLPGFRVSARSSEYQQGLKALREADCDLAIVLLGAEPAFGYAMIEEVHRNAPSTHVLALSRDENPETIIKAMRAGADEFLPLPVTQNALLKVCIKVSEIRRVNSPNTGPRGAVWMVHSPKGGAGVTTVVANLGFALRAAGRDTALVDLDCASGDLALFLNITPAYTLRDIVTNSKRLDSLFLQGSMSRHGSGLELLAAPAQLPGEPPMELSDEQTRAVLELLRTMHEVTIVDTPHTPTPATRAAILAADRVLLLTELTVPSLRRCLRTLDWMREEGIDPENKIELVVNKFSNRPVEVPPAEAAKTLKLTIRATLPRDDVSALTAINKGLPLAEVGASQPLAKAIAALAETDASNDTDTRPKGLLRLFASKAKRA